MNKKLTLILVSILALILVVLGWWVIIHDPNPPLQVEPTAAQVELIFPASAQEINWDDREIYKSGLTADAQSALAELPQASTYYISLEINEEITQDIIGQQIVRYFNAESEPLAEMDRFVEAMVTIRQEIAKVETGEFNETDNPLKNSPHTCLEATSSDWSHAYSREQAAFPTGAVNKYWPPVARIDNVYGDRNLFCACPPIDSYRDSE